MALRFILDLFEGRASEDGAGVKLIRVLDPRRAKETDPFLLFDEFRSDTPGDYAGGFPPHPHRGFETVTYLMAGNLRHGDNHGNSGKLTSGGAQWMTAGRGIVHEEMPEQVDGLMWGYQLWVNLPAKEKMTAPVYQDIAPASIPEVALPGGGRLRVVAGEFQGTRGAVSPRPTEAAYFDVTLPPGQVFEWEPPSGHTVLVHGISGGFRIGDDARRLRSRQMAQLSRDGAMKAIAGEEGAQFLVIAGKPLHEPIAHYGPFVMNTREEVMQAVEDFREGRF
jgi:quercetin 2,3-dioxygenase